MPISNPPYIPRFGSGIPTGSAAPGTIYFDRANQYAMYVYDANNAQWNPMGAFGPYAPVGVQSAFNPNGQTATFGQAPTNGNLLVCFTITGSGARTANTGWTERFTPGGIVASGNNIQVFSKVVSGDGATVTPITAAVTVGTLGCFEIAHAAGTFDTFVANVSAGSVASDNLTITPSGAGFLLLGMSTIMENNTDVFPTFTGANLFGQSANVNRQASGFQLYPGVNGANLVTGNVSTNRNMSMMGISLK